MLSFQRPSSFVCRTLALTTVFGASVIAASAQAAQTATGTDTATVAAKPAINLQLPASELNAANIFSSSSSSNDQDVATATPGPLAGLNAMQYGGGRRYGRPRYRGGNTTADGTSKYTFVIGGGFTKPVNGSERFLDTSWSVKGGAGRNFNKHIGVLIEYNYDNFGLTTLNNQIGLLNSVGYTDDQGNPYDFSQLDGNAHAWSITINPIIHLIQGEKMGMYITGGGGFYRKLTNFTLPQEVTGCDPYYGYCSSFIVNQTAFHYSNNAGGANGGVGFDYKLSRFSGERLFAEARYTWIDNSQSQNSARGLYPANNARTIYVPVTVGLRF